MYLDQSQAEVRGGDVDLLADLGRLTTLLVKGELLTGKVERHGVLSAGVVRERDVRDLTQKYI